MIPLALDTFGNVATESLKLLRRLAVHWSRRSSRSYDLCYSMIMTNLQCTLALSNARMIETKLRMVPFEHLPLKDYEPSTIDGIEPRDFIEDGEYVPPDEEEDEDTTNAADYDNPEENMHFTDSFGSGREAHTEEANNEVHVSLTYAAERSVCLEEKVHTDGRFVRLWNQTAHTANIDGEWVPPGEEEGEDTTNAADYDNPEENIHLTNSLGFGREVHTEEVNNKVRVSLTYAAERSVRLEEKVPSDGRFGRLWSENAHTVNMVDCDDAQRDGDNWVDYVSGIGEESNQENQKQEEDNQAVESNARIVSYGDGGG